jgi:hypothetical protein
MNLVAARSSKPIPSGIVRALAEQLRREGTVWEGRGRRPVDEVRPALNAVLMQRLGLSRSVIQRALHGRSRAAPVSNRASQAPRLSRSESRSDLGPPGKRSGANAYYRAISAAMAAAQQLPSASPRELPMPPTTRGTGVDTSQKNIRKDHDNKDLDDIFPTRSASPAGVGGRGLDAIGLHSKPAHPQPPSISAPMTIRDPRSSQALGGTPAILTQGRQLLEDGIDLLLSSGVVDPVLKRQLLDLQDVLRRL